VNPGEAELIPGQLTLPGMPSPDEATAGQATLPGLEWPEPGGGADGRVADDGELAAVAAELRALDGDGSRMAAAIRDALDMLLDGQHTGRYRWDQLHKTEILIPNQDSQVRAASLADSPAGMAATACPAMLCPRSLTGRRSPQWQPAVIRFASPAPHASSVSRFPLSRGKPSRGSAVAKRASR
jgi:hypothetical protein